MAFGAEILGGGNGQVIRSICNIPDSTGGPKLSSGTRAGVDGCEGSGAMFLGGREEQASYTVRCVLTRNANATATAMRLARTSGRSSLRGCQVSCFVFAAGGQALDEAACTSAKSDSQAQHQKLTQDE